MIFSLLVGSALALANCASGPSYAEALKTMPPIPKGKGRVFVYRDSTFGAAVRPAIKIDDQKIGTSFARGFSYSDQPAGSHVVSLTTEVRSQTNVRVASGQPSFVHTYVTMGVFVGHVVPSFVDKSEGEAAIRNCRLVTE